MQPPIVLVDIDGVLADFNAGTIHHLLQRRPDTLIPEFTHFRTYHNFDDVAIKAEIMSIQNTEGFFRNLPIMDDALIGWQRLIDLGYQPRICSSPLRSNPLCEAEKRGWIAEHFGADVATDAIIDRNKYRHDGIALIDDRTDLLYADKASWQQILFDAIYNQDFETDYRLRGWRDPALADLLSRINATTA